MPNLLKDFPIDVRRAVLLKQAEIKADKNQGKYSLKSTLIRIIKEWMEVPPKKIIK